MGILNGRAHSSHLGTMRPSASFPPVGLGVSPETLKKVKRRFVTAARNFWVKKLNNILNDKHSNLPLAIL